MSTLPISDTQEVPPRRAAPRHNMVITLVATATGAVLIATGLAIASDGADSSPASTVAATAATAGSSTAAGSESVADTSTTTTTTLVTAGSSAAMVSDASDIGELVVPSVVTIEISDTFRTREIEVASGSGVIWDSTGHIVTNAHVVEAGRSYEVVTADGRVYAATLVGVDETTDLAVLEVDADNLTPIARGSTEGLLAGDPAIAVGSPLGLDGGPSLTIGVISALGRTVNIDSSTSLFGMIQADAPITEGSSGGALVDDQGSLIGITSAVGVSTVGVEGIGFSTPIEIVERVAAEIISTGRASQPMIGISGTTAFTDMADGGAEPTGVQVEEISPGSAAGSAGIQVGDIIAAIDGREINTMAELISETRTHAAGDIVELTVLGSDETTSVTLGDG